MHRYKLFISLSIYLFLAQGNPLQAQDTLFFSSGQKTAFIKLRENRDAISIITYPDRNEVICSPDSVIGYKEELKEHSRFLLQPTNIEKEMDYFFAERLEVGPLMLFKYDKSGLALYLSKNGEVERIFSAVERGDAKARRLARFLHFLSDDSESVAYVSSPSFDFKYKEVIKVIQYYNKRNFIEKKPSSGELMGNLYLYRTKFQKTEEGMKIIAYGDYHDLYINDFIQLQIPVNYATKLTIKDRNYKSELLVGGAK